MYLFNRSQGYTVWVTRALCLFALLILPLCVPLGFLHADEVGAGEEVTAPEILVFSVSPSSVPAGDDVSIDLQFSAVVTYTLVIEDIDGNEVTRFEGESEDPDTIVWTPSAEGEYAAVIDITNAGGSTGDALDITVTAAEVAEPEPEPGAYASGSLTRVGGGSTVTTGDTVTLSVTTTGVVTAVTATVEGVSKSLTDTAGVWSNTWTVASSFSGTLAGSVSGNSGAFTGVVTSSLTYTEPLGITAPSLGSTITESTTMTLVGSSLECSIDGVTFADCESGDQILSLPEGTSVPDGDVELTVRSGSTVVTRTLVKDTTAPTKLSISIQDQAMRVSTTTSIVITFSEAPSASTLRARLTPTTAVNVSIAGAVVTITPTVSLEDGEDYTLTVYGISDAAGNPGTTITHTFRTNAAGTLSLQAGWNLISLPLLSGSVSPASLFGAAVEEVWAYDTGNSAAVSGWLTYTEGAPEGVNTLSTLEPGRAYWVKVSSGLSVTVSEASLEGPVTPPSVTLHTGWNLIGPFGLPGDTEKSVHDGLESLLDEHGEETWTALWALEEGVLATPSVIEVGHGYWIYIQGEREHTPTS